MPTKPNAQNWAIKEQIIEDKASGLTLQFEVMETGHRRLLIVGDLRFGNREFIFGDTGALGATGTACVDECRPSWLKAVPD